MRVVDLKALAKVRGLRDYSRLNKAELIAFIRNNLQPHTRPPPIPAPRPRPPGPTRPPLPPPSVRFRPDRPRQPEVLRKLGERQPSSQEMDILEQKEMRKNRPQVKSKLNDCHDWLVNHVPKTIKNRASRVFKAFKEKVIGLYKDDKLIKEKTQPYQLKPKRSKEPTMPTTEPAQGFVEHE